MTNPDDRDRDAIDHEENCAACGVYERADGSRYCDGCRDALVRADGGEVQATAVEREPGEGESYDSNGNIRPVPGDVPDYPEDDEC